MMISVVATTCIQPVMAATPHTKLPQRSRDAYPRSNSFIKSSKKSGVANRTNPESLNSYNKVQNYILNRDSRALNQAVKNGLSLEGKNTQGDTAVCVAVKRNDFIGFSFLKSAGANLAPSCMKEIPVEQRKIFIQKYMGLGGYISLAAQESMLSNPSDFLGAVSAFAAENSTALVVTGGVVAVGTVVAVAAGGGGSSGGGGDVPSDPTDPAYYETDEFKSKFSTADKRFKKFKYPMNFLGQINAQYIYAYQAAHGQPIAGQGVTIGIIDAGLDTTHPDLAANVLKDVDGNAMGLNFNYGPCSAGDTTNCWVYDGTTATLYGDTPGSVKVSYTDKSRASQWAKYVNYYPVGWDWDTQKNTSNPITNDHMHGTYVAGLAAATKNDDGIHGVAYNSKLIGVDISVFMDGTNWFPYTPDIYNGYKYAVDNGARVLNNSWGNMKVTTENTPAATAALFNMAYADSDGMLSLKSAIEYATWKGAYSSTELHPTGTKPAIVVFAAGNAREKTPSLTQPSIESGAPTAIPSLLYYKEGSELKPFDSFPTDVSKIASSLFVSVVAVNSNNSLASYSQKCGIAAPWCIAAPGAEAAKDYSGNLYYGIVSTAPGGEYDMGQGTSAAAPVVSGALATIMAASPSLSPQEVVEIMFRTATDLGVSGVDEVYGHGLVNLQAALSPIGTMTLALGETTTENQVSFAGTHFSAPRTFNLSVLNSLPEKIVVLDEYKRAFGISTSSIIKTNKHSKQAFADNLSYFTKWHRPQKMKLNDNFDLKLSENPKTFSNEKLNGLAFALTYHQDNISSDFSFTQNAKEGMENYFNQALLNPFTSNAKDVYALQNSIALSKTLKFGFGASVGKNNFFDGNERLDYRHEKSIRTGQVNLNYQPVDFANINVLGGMLDEKDSLLGMNGLGGMKTTDGQTYFMGAQLSIEPMDKVRLSAAYYYGSSRMKNQNNSLMRLSNVQSESMAFKAEYQLDEDVLLGIRGGSPLHIRKATASFDLPVARDAVEDKIYRERVTANLKSQAKEWDWGVFGVYNMNAWTFQTEAMTRINPDNQSGLKPDYRLMFSVGFGY